MTSMPPGHDSFVLRIWREQADAEAGGEPIWRAWVQHIHSGEAAYVQDVAGLLAFIERWAGNLAVDQTAAARLK